MATASWSSSTLVQSQIIGFSGGLRQSRSHPKFSHLYKTLRRIQEALSTVDKDQPSSLAAVALKEKRLIFTWLDGEAQHVSPFVCQACQCFPSLVVVQFTFVVVNGLINLRVMYVMCMVLGHNLF
ncbi:unnamed protein product [Camellia sinensis]